MKRIKANELRAGRHRGLSNEEHEQQRDECLYEWRRERGGGAHWNNCVISSTCVKKPRVEKQVAMQRIMFTDVCVGCRWLRESRH